MPDKAQAAGVALVSLASDSVMLAGALVSGVLDSGSWLAGGLRGNGVGFAGAAFVGAPGVMRHQAKQYHATSGCQSELQGASAGAQKSCVQNNRYRITAILGQLGAGELQGCNRRFYQRLG